MLRIYLDQFAWIGLARAAHGRANGREYAEALTMCRAARRHGLASFPLDLYRYWETSKNANDGSRNRLADVMIELSDFDTITVSTLLLDHEIDVALNARFGRPGEVPPPRVFGRGITHLTNGAVSTTMPPADRRPPWADKSSDLRAPIDRQLEETLLRAGPRDHARAGLPLDLVDWGGRYANQELALANDIASQKIARRDILPAVVHADFKDIIGAIRARMTTAGISPQVVVDTLGERGLLELVHSLPTRRVTNVLRLSKHLHSPQHQRWKPSDFFDVISLPVPTVYCDAVFTEKQWVTALTRKDDRLDRRFDTRLISSPAQLVELLIAATA